MSISGTIFVDVGDRKIPVTVIRSSSRKMRLRITKNGNAELTLPLFTSVSEAEAFLKKNGNWLKKNCGIRTFFSFPEELRTGDRILYLGKEMPVWVESGNGASLEERNGILVLRCRNAEDPGKAAAAFGRELRKNAKELFSRLLDRHYPMIEKQYDRPKIVVKEMTSRWGSASPSNGIINLSLYLMKTPEECAESVVVHEVAHYLRMDHSDAFYRIVLKEMPDYHQWHKILKQLAKT